jgi:RNA polymerase-binding transcription factor DksA
MQVKCSECYKVFKISNSRKYVHCSHCEAELDLERLEVVPENKATAKESIFSKALKKTEGANS